MNKKYFYRIGNQSTGLWYDQKGEFTGIIHTDKYEWLGASILKMPFDEEIKGFLSVADSLEHLYQWFTASVSMVYSKRNYNTSRKRLLYRRVDSNRLQIL